MTIFTNMQLEVEIDIEHLEILTNGSDKVHVRATARFMGMELAQTEYKVCTIKASIAAVKRMIRDRNSKGQYGW